MKQILDSLPTVWKLHSHSWKASFRQLRSSFPTGRKLPKKLPSNFCYWESPFLQLLGFLPQLENSLPTVWKHSPHSWDLESSLFSSKVPSYWEAPFPLGSLLSTRELPRL